jgi:hypothetical protein
VGANPQPMGLLPPIQVRPEREPLHQIEVTAKM